MESDINPSTRNLKQNRIGAGDHYQDLLLTARHHNLTFVNRKFHHLKPNQNLGDRHHYLLMLTRHRNFYRHDFGRTNRQRIGKFKINLNKGPPSEIKNNKEIMNQQEVRISCGNVFLQKI